MDPDPVAGHVMVAVHFSHVEVLRESDGCLVALFELRLEDGTLVGFGVYDPRLEEE